MILEKVHIKNFRSIADMELNFGDYDCKVLVGINGVGKTNILKALRLLDSKVEISNDDPAMNVSIGTEQEAFVKFYFKLDKAELKKAYEELESKIYSFAHKTSIVNEEKATVPLEDFLNKYFFIIYTINLKTKTRNITFALSYLKEVKLDDVYGIIEEQYKNQVLPAVVGNKTVNYAKYTFFKRKDVGEVFQKLLTGASFQDIYRLFCSIVTDKYKLKTEEIMNVVYWEYSDKYILPDRIDRAKFQANSKECLPLESMCHLAKINDIAGSLKKAYELQSNYPRTLWDKVAKKSTNYIKSVWQGFENSRFVISPDGNFVDMHILGTDNYYTMGQCSSGFKRLITFLLLISAKSVIGELSNTLILIDEPDISIHIQGQRNLMNNLIALGKKNYVLYSTHSPFMIDRDNISRHLVIKKDNEQTTIEQLENANYSDEEVINTALGYSVFEAIKSKNILFEGWTDKFVFDLVNYHKKTFVLGDGGEIGVVHCQGVKNIIPVTKLLDLANKNYIILSDSDQLAKDKKNTYEEDNPEHKTWFLYEELLEGIYTLEDFIESSVLEKVTLEVLKDNNIEPLHPANFITNPYKKIMQISDNINLNDKKMKNNIIRKIKDKLYHGLKIEDVNHNYFDLLEKLKKIVEKGDL